MPDANLSMPFISQKDRDDILFGIQQDVDFIAASFTRTEEDILSIRKLLNDNGGKGISIIAKIENMQGVQNIDSILAVSDGVMVARGDLGVEIPLEQIPIIQKMIIRKAYSRGRQIITATQMLDSMIKNPRPTRAEATDVANAIYDGTGSIMLSGETAAGLYPVEAVRTMARIAQVAEASIDYVQRFKDSAPRPSANITNAISHASMHFCAGSERQSHCDGHEDRLYSENALPLPAQLSYHCLCPCRTCGSTTELELGDHSAADRGSHRYG